MKLSRPQTEEVANPSTISRSKDAPAPANRPATEAHRPDIRRRPGFRIWLRRVDVVASPYLYIAPFFLLFLGFALFPLGYTFYVSLNDWNLIGADQRSFTGLANYRRLLSDSFFWNALRNTFSIWLLSTVPQMVFALGLAHLLNTRLRAKTFFRMGVLVPNVASLVAVTIIFAQLFGRDFGLVNWVLETVGLDPINWQAGKASSHIAIAVMVVWRWTGYHALIFLAAMQAIPKQLYEAASLDGAGSFQMLRNVTIPALRPVIIFSVLISTIYGMQIFAEPLLFDPRPGSVTGGSGRQFQTLSVYLYEQGFRDFDFGYAATVGWVMFLVVVLVALLNYTLTRRISST